MEIPASLTPNPEPVAQAPVPEAAPQEMHFVNPMGDIVAMPAAVAAEALKQGYEPASPEQVTQALNEEKYGGVGQQAITALEGAGVGATFGLSTGLERMMGVSPKDIRARAETNPVAHGIGEAAGTIGSLAIPGFGEAHVLEQAGISAAKALIPASEAAYSAARALHLAKEAGVGVEAAQTALKIAKEAQPFLVKVGTQAAEQAVQFSMMQSGNELSKMFASDPNQSVGSAIADIGLSGVIGGVAGGGIGAVSPLWNATVGNKAENFLNKLKSRVNGETIPIASDLQDALKNVAPEIRAGLSEDPQMRAYFQTLIESGTKSGDALRETLEKFKQETGEKIKTIFNVGEGKTAHEAGNEAKQGIMNKADELNANVKKMYDDIADTAEFALPDEERLKFYDKLIEQGQNFGAKGGPASELFKLYGERALAQDTLGQLDKLVTEIGSARSVAYRAGDFEKSKALAEITDAIRDFQENQIGKASTRLAKEAGDESIILAGELIKDQRSQARAAYRDFMEQIGEIASVGKLGKIKSYSQLQDVLEQIPAAKLADKLFDRKNVEGLKYLKEKFPDVLDSLIKQKKTEIIEAATKGGDLMHNQLLTSVNKLPEEVKKIMFTGEELGAINSAGKILRESNIRMNPSGTARTADTLWKNLPAGVGAVADILNGHSGVTGLLAGEALTLVSRTLPDAVKLSLLKFMGSPNPVDAGAWKAATQYISAMVKGQKAIENTIKSVFYPTGQSATNLVLTTANQREKLDKRLEDIQKNPSKMMDVATSTSHYLPDHGTALSQTAMSSVNYLNSIRPQAKRLSPLDRPIEPSVQEKAQYDRALDIANSPLSVVAKIKNGEILPSDVIALKSLYPALYSQVSQKLMTNMVEVVDKGESIPYRTRMGLSMFLGQPLDSTMAPQSIQMIQATFALKSNQPENVTSGSSKLNKVSENYQTPEQAREARHLKT